MVAGYSCSCIGRPVVYHDDCGPLPCDLPGNACDDGAYRSFLVERRDEYGDHLLLMSSRTCSPGRGVDSPGIIGQFALAHDPT